MNIAIINRWIISVMMALAGTGQSFAAESLRSTNLLSDTNALTVFVDGLVTNRMQEFHVPGAVVTIVKGNRILLNKGYGLANLEEKLPVDPDKTLFRIASVSKVFNAMTVMRLVDEGTVDLDEEVRPRLAATGFNLDNDAYGSVTLKGLLTHTAGIRDLSIPGVTSNPDPTKILPLRSYLEKGMPLRWQPPNETVLYTDHGITLAGYVVEVASKTKYEKAVQQKVLQPLGMTHTWYTVPEEQRPNLAVAYTYATNSSYQPNFFRHVNHYPATGVFTTGSDMARLMFCHLSGCRDFLKPQTAKLMHEPQYADDARLGVQWTCGFVYETHPRGKEPYLFHMGGVYGFQSALGISTSRGIGVFVAQNRPGPHMFQLSDLLDQLPAKSERAKSAKTTTKAAAVSEIKTLAGTYALNRTLSYGGELAEPEKVYVRYVEEIKGIEIAYWHNKENPMRFTQVAPMLFRSTKGDEQVSFRISKDGKRTYLLDYNVRGDGAFKKIAP